MIRDLATGAVCTTAATTPDPGLRGSMDAGDVATFAGVIATLLVGIIAAVIAVKTYKTQQRESRRQQKATFFADAVRAVEDYMEGPYRILRKDGSTQARREITQHISDVKSRISFYTGWMAIHGSDKVRAAYNDFVTAAQREAGPQMTSAWEVKPVKKDNDVPRRTPPLTRTATDAARDHLLTVMSTDLRK